MYQSPYNLACLLEISSGMIRLSTLDNLIARVFAWRGKGGYVEFHSELNSVAGLR
jgi:hypothetical protein